MKYLNAVLALAAAIVAWLGGGTLWSQVVITLLALVIIYLLVGRNNSTGEKIKSGNPQSEEKEDQETEEEVEEVPSVEETSESEPEEKKEEETEPVQEEPSPVGEGNEPEEEKAE